MKSKRLLLMLLLALLVPWAANAQNRTIVTIGEGTSTQRYPLPGYYGYQYDVYIYTPTAAPALDADCDISSIAFNVTTNNTNGESTMEIWVKDVDADYALATATTFDTYTADAELVYENDDFTSTTGWNTLAFTRDFSHQGGKALLVAVRGTGCGTSACSRMCTYTTASSTTWYKHQDNSDPGTNVSGTVSSSRANIQLDLTYTGTVCLSPSGLAASNVTDNSATLSWNENGEATAWVLQYGTDSEFGTYTEENVSTTPTFGLTGLTALTTYYARVKPDCDTEGSHWSNTVTFTTTAVATVVGDGWSDDFEGASCDWELINGTLTNQWAWGTAANNGGTHGLYISNDGGTTNAYSNGSAAMVYATKLLNFTDGKYEFAYDWKANGETTYDYLRVALVPASVTLTAGTSAPSGFSTTGLPSGWIALDGGSKLNQVTEWQNKSLAVNVTAGNYYLVMAWKDDTSGGTNPPAAVDNVSITRMACPYDVTDLAVTANSITTSGATITWTAGEAEEWQVATKAGNGEWTILPNTFTTNSATLTGLTAATTYQVRVRAYCNANDQGAWCDAISFTTECEAIDLALVDYSENFDSYTAGTGVLPVCWNRINEGTSTSYNQYPYIYNYGANSGSNSLRFYSYGTSGTSDQYAILPEMENMEGKQITLQAKAYNTGNTFKIGMMTDPTDATTFEVIGEKTLTTSYEECSFILGRGNYVAIMMEKPTSSTTKGVYIDDITIADVPACMKPSDLTFVSATTTGATLSWTNGAEGQTAWQIVYSTNPNFDPDDATLTPVDVTSNPGTIDGLTASTTYYAYVRANCGNDGYSDWSAAYVQFATACEAITTFPVSYNFETSEGFPANASTPTTNQLGACWRNEATVQTGSNSTRVWGTSTSYKHEGSQALVLPDKGNSSNPAKTMLVFPEMTFTSERGYTVSFWINRNNNGTNPEGFKVYISDTDTISANAVELGHYSRNYGIAYPVIESASGWYQYEIEIPKSMMTGNVFLIFEGQSYYGSATYVDEVLVKEIPTCQTPSGLAFVSSTTTSATLGWTAGGTETAWQIMLNDDEEHLIMADSNPFTIEDLTASTSYTAKVRAYCSESDQSEWSTEISFATLCEPITITAATPYTQNFEAPVVTTTYSQVGEMPTCWDNYPVGGAASAKILAAGAQYNYASEGQVLYFYGSGNNYAVLPEFTNALNELQISFKYATESNSYGTLTLGYITDEDEAYNTFTAIEGGTFNASSDSDDTFVDVDPISLSALPANATRLVFRWYYSGQWGCNVDDVNVEKVACPMPFNLAVNYITTNSATVQWNGTSNNYEMQYRTLNGEWTIVETENLATELTGLEVNTTYECQVRGYCDADSIYTDWTAVATFTTLNICAAPENLVIVPGDNSATVTWEGVQSTYKVYWGIYDNGVTYGQPEIVEGTMYTIEGLTSGQSYGVKVEGICGDSQTSEAVEDYFTTALLWTDPETWAQVPDYNGNPEQTSAPEVINVPENMTVVIPENTVVTVNQINLPANSEIIIENGGELNYQVADPEDPTAISQGIEVTMSMNIDGPTRNNSGYRLIASPIYETIGVEDCGLTANYYGMDLYSFDANYPRAEWRNYKTNDNFSDLEIGKGYLYYNTEAVFVTFFGQTIPSNVIYPIDLAWSPNAYYDDWKGFNLVGNPFTCTAYPNRTFYVLNNEGNEVVLSDVETVGPMKAFFVSAAAEGEKCMMSKTPSNMQSTLNLTLVQDQNLVDRAAVNFGKSENLLKVQLNPNHTKVYIPVDGNDYAAANAESNMGEMPVNFKAENNGSYTLNFASKNVNFNYLHLIDNMTGADVNLLANPSYTFNAKSTDYASRFKLVYSTGSSVDGESFAFINGAGNLSIFGIEGTATLQVMDLTGRILSSETFSGSYEKSLNVAPGVYMIRLINGNDVKVQKMIVK